MAMGLGASRAGGRGRRGGRRRRALAAEINVTPFVDVMLVLLIVFMITAPLLTAGVEVSLPQANAKPLPADVEPLTVTVDAEGKIFLGGSNTAEATSLEDLPTRLEALAAAGFDSRIFIRSDKDAASGRLVQVLAVINTAGYRNLGIVTESPGAGANTAPPRPADDQR